MPVQTCHTDFTDLKASWTEYAYMGETEVRPAGTVDDPADLDIAYERAKAKVDREAESCPTLTPGEPAYRVYVRVVRAHRTTGL